MSDQAIVSREEALRNELRALTNRVAPPSSNKISTKGKLFTLPDGRTNPGPIEVIILDFISVNSWYEGLYNPQNKSPPACFAIGKDIESLAPSDKAPKQQAESCAPCPRNQWGTGQGGKGKACKNTRRMVVLAKEFDEKTAPMTLYTSPTGIKQLDAYIRRIVSEHAKRPIDVITQISFDANQSYPTLQFDFVDFNPNVLMAEKIRTNSEEMLLREPEVQAKAA